MEPKTLKEQLEQIDELHKFTDLLKEANIMQKDTDMPLSVYFKVVDLLQKTYMVGYRHGNATACAIYNFTKPNT